MYAKPKDEIHIVLTNSVFYFTGPRNYLFLNNTFQYNIVSIHAREPLY